MAMRVFSNRSMADLLLVSTVFVLPWWLSLSLAGILFFNFDYFIEFFLTAFLIDILYGVPFLHFFGSSFVLSLMAVPLYFLLSAIKKRMRFQVLA